LFLFSFQAFPQQFTRNEFTVGSGLLTYGNGPSKTSSGTMVINRTIPAATPSFTYTYNLSPSLALEGTFQPTSVLLIPNTMAGDRETLAMGGVKTGWRGRRWGLYGKVQAGVVSSSCYTWYWTQNGWDNCGRITNFAVEYGGVAEYRLNSRYSIRVDAAHLLITEFDQLLYRSPDGSLLQYRAGAVSQHLDARIGITRSFGELREAKPERVPNRSAWDLGAAFSLQPRTLLYLQFMAPYPSWGVWGSWNFSRHLSWDTSLSHSGRYPGNIEYIDFQAGGRSFEALTGLKAGIRRDHMGYFAKVRGGTITFGETERQVYRLPNNYIGADLGMFTNPVLDVGGVYEVYPSRHTILRFDAGSATIFYQPKNIIDMGQILPISGQTKTGMLMSFGAGFRF
jgi:hypothetical protein